MVQKKQTASDLPSANKVLTRKRQILRAASQAFQQNGFQQTGMRDIAEAMSMTVGSLYYYFRTKEELLAFCQEDTLVRLHSMRKWVNGLSLGPAQSIYLMIVGHILCLNEQGSGSIAHLDVRSLSPDNREEILRQRSAYELALRNEITRGIELGELREVDPKVASLSILGAANWSVIWFRPGGLLNAKEIGLEQATILVAGLLAAGQEFLAPTFEIPAFEQMEISTQTYLNSKLSS